MKTTCLECRQRVPGYIFAILPVIASQHHPRLALAGVLLQTPIQVFYCGQAVGAYFADLTVADVVIVELKAVQALAEEHEAQLLNYLKATRFEVGLLLNFGPKPQVKRKAYDNARKGGLSWVE